MRCERMQELLLTDYIDGELDEKLRRDVDEHVHLCASCRELKRAILERSDQTRKAAVVEEPPAYVWERLKAKILAEPVARRGVLSGAADSIKEAFSVLARIPRPALAFAASALVIMAFLVARPSADAGVNAYLAEQMDFMTRLDTAEGNGNGFFDTDLRTSAENII